MPDILIRGLDDQTVERLKTRARRGGRSLQGELKLILEQAAGLDPQAMQEMFAKWRSRLGERRFSDSTELIREDRER